LRSESLQAIIQCQRPRMPEMYNLKFVNIKNYYYYYHHHCCCCCCSVYYFL